MSAVAKAVGSFLGVSPSQPDVLENWKKSAEKKFKDGQYGIHMAQSVSNRGSDDKMVKRADNLLKTISLSLMRDRKEEEEEKKEGETDESEKEETDDDEQEKEGLKDSVISDIGQSDNIPESEVVIGNQPDSPSKVKVILVDTPVICGSEDNLKEIDGSSRSTSDMVKKPSTSDENVSKMTKEKDNTKRVSQRFGKAELVYGKDAFKHYKFFMAIENERKIIELKEILEDKMLDYEWKLKAIDDLVNLAKAYYNNPQSEQGEEWRDLKQLVRQKSQKKISETVIRHELSKLPIFRPIFTCFIIIVQLLVFAVLCGFGGVTYIGVEPRLSLQNDIKTFLGMETIHKWTPPNIWIGPDQRFLIGIGALYPPCMREDLSVQFLYSHDNFDIDEPLGCCEITSRNTAGTTTEQECHDITEGIGSWRSSSVCGKRASWDNSVAHVLKPCCVDLKGTCELVSHAHCLFIGGIFHRTGPEHCRQVNCLAGICNIGNLVASADQPWIPSRPDQWWRLPLSLLYHHGFVHVAMVTMIQWLIMRQIEQTAGWLRMALIYFISGMGSLLTSSLFEPSIAVVGGVGAVFGMIGVMLVELFQFWAIVAHPVQELLKILVVIAFFLGLGTLPYLDNFGMITGLLLGMLCAIILLPYVTFRRWHVKVRLILVAVALPTLFLVLFVLFYGFYQVQTFEACDLCRLLNCIPYTEKMCESSLWS